MSENNRNDEFEKFLITVTRIEKQREFDRQVDRLKKSSAAATVWAVIPGLFGIYGVGHFYLNRPIEGLIILLTGIVPTFFLLSSLIWFMPGFLIDYSNLFDIPVSYIAIAGIIAWIVRIVFLVGSVISVRYHYSRYDSYIHYKAKKPWNNWGLNSKV